MGLLTYVCTKDVDDGCLTQYYGVEVEFDQSRNSSHHNRNLIGGMLDYARKI